MKNVIRKLDLAILKAQSKLLAKREGNDQLIVMFIIIAVAAGVAGHVRCKEFISFDGKCNQKCFYWTRSKWNSRFGIEERINKR